ncbi:MAG: TonB family protein [Prolixibacteraceae bacterium]
METIGLLLLKSAVWLTGFALVYLVVLRNERYFRLNRLFLLCGIAASLLFPFYTFHYNVVIPFNPTANAMVGELTAGAIVPEESIAPTLYFWIYLIGISVVLLRLLFQTWKIIRKLREAGYEQNGVVKLVRTSEYASSFSFFSYVFVNPSTSTHEMQEIMNHEREHIQQRHWLDLLLVELLCVVQWFNPFAWIYARLVRQNHEFLADEKALQCSVDPVIYQAALLNQLLGAPVFSLTNSFSYSLNKKRFKMMKKKIDSPFRKLKMLVVLPLVAMLFYAFAVPEYRFENIETAAPAENAQSTVKEHVYLKSNTDLMMVAADTKLVDVKGQVFKSDGTPLPGTSVILKGSTIGAMSNSEGMFELKGVPSDGELYFSFVGFKTKVQKVDGQPMKIVMETSQIGLDQVTVVGYGTPPPPPPPPVSVRGIDNANPPLYFLDGIPISKAAMDKIDPNTIESINVLKDKSAVEKYGEKAKNGVILIKLKSGNITGSFSSSDNKLEVRKAETLDLTEKFNSDNPPLIILDGVQISKDEMSQVKPDQIESISVLKDQSGTKLFGEKGKNGVVLITTKAKAASQAGKGVSYSAEKVTPQDGVNVFTIVEEMPEFPGGENALRDFIGSKVKYPDFAVKENIQGMVFVTFVVKSDGTVGNAKVIRGVHPIIDEEALRVINLLPTWKPGKQRGQAVNVSYTIPVQFALEGDKNAKQALPFPAPKVGSQRPDGVYIVVEEMPEFPGGELALRDFIVSTVKYPAEAAKQNIQGKVFVTFVVKADGTVGDAKIARGVHPLLDDEAIRVVNLLPVWKPGRQKGEAVSVSYTVPVKFALDGGKNEKMIDPSLAAGPQKGEKQVFIVVEEMPEFPGGELELRRFIARTVKYPVEAQKDKIQGKVFVSFVVSSTGKVEQAKIERSVSLALDAEAIRVVSSSPEWKPGKQRGQAVSVAYTIPIEFKLQ